jgi:hypothetical protein
VAAFPTAAFARSKASLAMDGVAMLQFGVATFAALAPEQLIAYSNFLPLMLPAVPSAVLDQTNDLAGLRAGLFLSLR